VNFVGRDLFLRTEPSFGEITYREISNHAAMAEIVLFKGDGWQRHGL
jgi:hypothetical protein